MLSYEGEYKVGSQEISIQPRIAQGANRQVRPIAQGHTKTAPSGILRPRTVGVSETGGGRRSVANEERGEPKSDAPGAGERKRE